jgi:hypothetical protein
MDGARRGLREMACQASVTRPPQAAKNRAIRMSAATLCPARKPIGANAAGSIQRSPGSMLSGSGTNTIDAASPDVVA